MLQVIASEGLAQGPYVEARMRFEPATLRTQGTEPTTEPFGGSQSMSIFAMLNIRSENLPFI